MTRLETLLAACVGLAALLLATRAAPPEAVIVLIAVALVLAAANIVVNPLRWQIYPASLAAAGLAAAAWTGAAPIMAAVASFALLAASAALCWAMPAIDPPAPAGPHGVGAASLMLERPVDESHPPRRLLVKVWYPAPASARGAREPLWREIYGGREFPPLARMALGYLRRVKAHSRQGAPLARPDPPPPVLIYNHSLLSIASENTLLMERLASEGFVVASVRHLDQYQEFTETQAGVSDEERTRDRALQRELRGRLERSERARLSAELYSSSTGTPQIVARRAEDARYVVDHIDRVFETANGRSGSPSAEASSYGALGLSLGGAVATRLRAVDPRCRAVANIDGGLFGVAPSSSGAPYLMLYAAQNAGSNDALLPTETAAYSEEVIAGAKHLDFHDAAVVLPGLKLLGALSGHSQRVNARKNDAVAAFFRQVFTNS